MGVSFVTYDESKGLRKNISTVTVTNCEKFTLKSIKSYPRDGSLEITFCVLILLRNKIFQKTCEISAVEFVFNKAQSLLWYSTIEVS